MCSFRSIHLRAVHRADAMFAETKDPRYAAPVLMRRMVTAGYCGRKSGKGFYEYR